MGDAGVFKSLEWALTTGEVEALEHVTRELESKCQSGSFQIDNFRMRRSYLSVVAIQEDFLHKDFLLLFVESPARCDESRLSTNKTGNNLPNPTLTSHSLYIPLASLPMPKKKKIKKPHPRLIHRS